MRKAEESRGASSPPSAPQLLLKKLLLVPSETLRASPVLSVNVSQKDSKQNKNSHFLITISHVLKEDSHTCASTT